jgi:alkylation response protein AidB-like acyl-CoA dehydrogenase
VAEFEPASVGDTELLRDAVRSAFAQLNGPAEVRAAMATARGWEPAVWTRLANELTLPGLALPAGVGGSGYSVAELGIVFEEAGAALLCAPLLATAALAGPLLVALDDPDALAEYGPAIASGTLVATAALGGRVVARDSPDGWTLSGLQPHVVDGAHADLVLVVATVDDGVAVFAVEADAPGLDREQLVTLDQTRKQARLGFVDVPGRLIGARSSGQTVAWATDIARALLAAEQAGGAKRCLDRTVEYAKTRIQFGRAIGSFQAVKQRLAEMLVRVESARSAAIAATRAAADGAPDLAATARIAALICTEAYTWASAQMIQLHGGIGFTWEHDAHLYFKRARSSAQLLGAPDEHVAALAAWLDETVL